MQIWEYFREAIRHHYNHVHVLLTELPLLNSHIKCCSDTWLLIEHVAAWHRFISCWRNCQLWINSDKAEIFVSKPWRPKGYFQFKIFINVLVSFLRFIWITMLWVCSYYKYFNSLRVGIIFIRQNLTFKDVRLWRIKTVPELKRLSKKYLYRLYWTFTFHKNSSAFHKIL